MYYNSNSNKFRCYQNSSWTDCISSGSGSLQSAYNASGTPADITLADGKDLTITSADTTTDPNILINLQCDTSCSTNGRFAVQDDGTDIFTISPDAGNALGRLHVAKDNGSDELEVGDNIWTVNDNTARINLGNTADNSSIRIGQGSTDFGFLQWVYNATPANATLNFGTQTGQTLTIQTLQAANTAIGATSASAKLHVTGTNASTDLFKVTDGTATAVDVMNIADAGATTFRNWSNSSSAFRIQNADASNTVFNADTSNARIGVNTATPSEALHVVGNVMSAVSSTASATQDFNGVTFVPASPGTWTTGGDANWARTTTGTQEGAGAAISGNVADSEDTWLDFDYTVPKDGELRFYWQVDSEEDFDYLVFCIDDDANCNNTMAEGSPELFKYIISGNVGYTEVSIPVKAGSHSFRWNYGKDSVGDGGTDTAWVDNIRFFEGGAVNSAYITTSSTLTANGSALFQTTTDSSNAFQILNSTNDSIMNVDTANLQVLFGDAGTGRHVLIDLGTADGELEVGAQGGNFQFRLRQVSNGDAQFWHEADLHIGPDADQGTTTASLFIDDRLFLGVDSVSIADNGNGGTAATHTLNPDTGYVEITCNDAQGCDVTMDEAAPVEEGQTVFIVNVGSNTVNFANSAGVQHVSVNPVPLGQYDTISFLYIGDRWVQSSRSDNL
jgi:hypothetical protein